MTSRDFCYWLQGSFELNEPQTLNKKQTELIKKHLNMVFIHEIDPSHGDEEHQGKLTAAHQGVQPQDLKIELPPQLPSIPVVLVQESLVVQPHKSIAKDIKYRC
jgi:hypothetical protein